MVRSNSSCHEVSLREKLVYNYKLFQMRLQGGSDATRYFDSTLRDVQEYTRLYQELSGRQLADARVLEIGFGARPFRAFAMRAHCQELTAVDLDEPAFTLRDSITILRRNGFERALKSALRLALFDKRMWKEFHSIAESSLHRYDPQACRLIAADATSSEFWRDNPGPYDLIYSEDVFEHIPEASLTSLLDRMQHHLSPSGIAIIRPFVFTGVSGGHNIEAYPDRIASLASSLAWQHLRDSTFKVDTYLNRLPRRWYRDEFAKRFQIVEDNAILGMLGKELLSDEIREQLSQFDDYELFSNKINFVLKSKH